MALNLPPIPASFRPGGPTTPRRLDWHHKFLTAEEDATAKLMGFYEQARLELETFIREGDLTLSDAQFFRKLLDETNRVGSKLNKQGATWTTSVIPEAYSAAWRTHSSVSVPQGALDALSKQTFGRIRQSTIDIQERIRRAIASGMLSGLSGADLRARIMATGLQNIPHWPSIEYRAGVIARTETMESYNAGAEAGMIANGAAFAEWIVSPDEAVCPRCSPLAGKIIRIGSWEGPNDPYPNALSVRRPPRHPRCRCTIIAIYRGPDGNVIRQGTAELPEGPKLPSDAMGGKSPPTVPPAAGDFLNSLKTLGLKAGDPGFEAAQAYWRNVDFSSISIDAGARGALDVLTSDLTAGQYADLWKLRYGIDLIGPVKGLSTGERLRMLEAIESFERLGVKWREEETLRQISTTGDLGPHPLIPGGKIPALYSPVEQMVKLSDYGRALTYGRTQGYGIYDGVDGLRALMEHEIAHALERRLLKGELADEWVAIHDATKGGPALVAAAKELARQLAALRKTIRLTRSNLARWAAEEAAEPTVAKAATIVKNQELLQVLEQAEGRLSSMQAAAKKVKSIDDAFPSSYGANNSHEDFAESVWLYIHRPADLKARCPARYKFLQKIIGTYK